MNMFKRCIIALLTIILALPVLPANTIASAASKPSLSQTTMNLIGVGATSSTIKLNNVDMSKVKRLTWYTQNEKVAIVESASKDNLSAKVTAVGKGKTNVRVKITYKNGDVVRPSCSVTVKIPATGVEISNAKENNKNRHVIIIGESYDFNRTITPSNTNAKTYWFLQELTDANIQKDIATVDSKGIVTASKPGLVRLVARAALTKEEAALTPTEALLEIEDLKRLPKTDAVIIEIVEKSAQVEDVTLTNNTTLKVKFNIPMDPDTIITKNKKLSDSVRVIIRTDAKGVTAKSYGELTGSLSTDGKELTITATTGFNGLYEISLSNSIKSKDGLALIQYGKTLELYDKIPPTFIGVTNDETGFKVSLNFSEPIDISGLKIEDAKAANPNEILTAQTVAILKEKSNYKLSKDRKSIEIDLTGIYDQNKYFSVTASGIKDDAGLTTEPYFTSLHFKADTSPKPQAQLISLLRTGYDTLTATFDRGIQEPGYAQISSNYEYIWGVVDKDDNKKVNYTLSQFSQSLTSVQEVTLSSWSGYNVVPNSTGALTTTKRSVNFTISTNPPMIKAYEVTVDQNDNYLLKLTYTEDVTTLMSSGYFNTRLVKSNSNDIYGNHILGYTAIYEGNVVTLSLTKEHFVESGTYTVTIPTNFVRNKYMITNQVETIVIKKDAAVSTELPAPKSVYQATDNPSIVYVTFGHKVDEVTAQNVSNYTISGTTVISAVLIDNNADGATVALTLAPDTVIYETLYPIYISNIMGYHNTYTAMKPYTAMIHLRKNRAPSITESKYVYNNVVLTFDDEVEGIGSFMVMQGNRNLASYTHISGRTVTITLSSIPQINTMLIVSPNYDNDIRDKSGNKVTILSRNVLVTSY